MNVVDLWGDYELNDFNALHSNRLIIVAQKMNPLTYIILFGSVVLGALIVKIFKAQSGKRMKLLIAFSGAYLFAITVLHLIPEIYHTNTDGVYIGLFILIGSSCRLFWSISLKVLNMGTYNYKKMFLLV